MWLFTTRGFYSVVQDRDDHERVLVRARREEDLEALRDLIPALHIDSDSFADYTWRAFVNKNVWRATAALLADEIDYDNFKNAVGDRQGGERAYLYSDVWRVMIGLESLNARAR